MRCVKERANTGDLSRETQFLHTPAKQAFGEEDAAPPGDKRQDAPQQQWELREAT